MSRTDGWTPHGKPVLGMVQYDLENARKENARLRSELQAAYCKIDAIEQQLHSQAKFDAEQHQEVHRLQAELSKCREALKEIEFVGLAVVDDREGIVSMYICPWCEGYPETGHASDCPRQRALESAA